MEWVDIRWPVNTTLEDGTRVHLGISNGAGSVRNVRVMAFLEEAELDTWIMAPNGSIDLTRTGLSGSEVDYFLFRLSLRPGTIDEIVLRELALFRPNLLPLKTVLKSPLPRWRKQLRPRFVSEAIGLHADVSHGELIILGDNIDKAGRVEPVTWITDIDKEMTSNNNYLDLRYSIPWQVSLSQPCWLEMTMLNSVGDRASRKLCLEYDYRRRNASDRMFIPLPRWVSRIEWRMIWPVDSDALAALNHQAINLSFDMNWIRPMTAWELIERQPILKLSPIHWIDEADAQQDGVETYFYPQISPLLDNAGGLALGQLQKEIDETMRKYSFSSIDNPWLELNQIILTSNRLFSLEEWRNSYGQIDIGHGIELSRIIRLFSVIFALIILAWFVATGRVKILIKNLIWICCIVWKAPLNWLCSRKGQSRRLDKIIEFLISWPANLILWFFVTVFLYIFGIMGLIKTGENLSFTLAGITAVLAWRAFVGTIRPLSFRWPLVAKSIYDDKGTHYFLGSGLILLAIAIFKLFGVGFITEQLAIVGYYMLVIGVVLKVTSRPREINSIENRV